MSQTSKRCGSCRTQHGPIESVECLKSWQRRKTLESPFSLWAPTSHWNGSRFAVLFSWCHPIWPTFLRIPFGGNIKDTILRKWPTKPSLTIQEVIESEFCSICYSFAQHHSHWCQAYLTCPKLNPNIGNYFYDLHKIKKKLFFIWYNSIIVTLYQYILLFNKHIEFMFALSRGLMCENISRLLQLITGNKWLMFSIISD